MFAEKECRKKELIAATQINSLCQNDDYIIAQKLKNCKLGVTT